MTSTTLQFGTERAAKLRDSSSNGLQATQELKTVNDLLIILEQAPPKELKMLRSTCVLLSTFLEAPVDALLIDTVNGAKQRFRPFLERRKYAENSVRSYINYVTILLRHARNLGWRESAELSKEWSKILAVAKKKKCAAAVRYMASTRKTPSDVTIEDVEVWAKSEWSRGLSFDYARSMKNGFWRCMHDCGYTEVVPLSILRLYKYGIRVKDFPAEMRNELISLIEWKTAEYSIDRPKNAQFRPVTAIRLRSIFCLLYGFAINIQNETGISSLSSLVRQPLVSQFVMWCINHRKVKGASLQRNLRLIGAVFTQHPSYRSVEMSWFKPLLDGIPTERESEAKERKAEKYLEYSVLEAIPGKVKAEIQKTAHKGAAHVADLATKALLIKWLTILPWRQKNVRQCKISGPKPNLFKAKIAAFSSLAKPEWMLEAERQDPNAEFWQFKFSHLETKMKNDVHALLPRQLIGPLEEYLRDFRPSLVVGSDPDTLFLNKTGRSMSQGGISKTVSEVTLKHGGRRVTPHLFRDIVAFTWLSEHPQDYLTVSKLLWHTSINTTLRVYGSRFNESSAVSRMEAWLDDREKS